MGEKATQDKASASKEIWRGDLGSQKKDGKSLAEKLLGNAATAQDVASILSSHPEYVGPILVLVNKRLGNKIAVEAANLANVSDHSAAIYGREALGDDDEFRNAEVDDQTAVAPSTPLPFTKSGWNSVAIATKLGQYDRIDGTNNDGERCSFANLLVAKVMTGPQQTSAYLRSVKKRVEGGSIELVQGRSDAMGASALVLEAVAASIDAGTATYGDLSWAMEALYEIFVDTLGSGTTAKAAKDFIGQDLGNFHIGRELKGSSVPHDPKTGAGCVYEVAELEDWGASLADGQSYVCVWIGPESNPQEVSHQIMLVKQGGKPYLYDPEIHGDGKHLFPLSDARVPLYFKGDRRIAMTMMTEAPSKDAGAQTKPKP